MINFRYHVVSLTAVLLALAAGVVLGAGFLDTDQGGDDTPTASVDPALADFDTGYADATSAGLLDGRLDEQSVVILTTPGARADDVDGIRTAIEGAGGTVLGDVALTAKLLDPSNRQFADGVATQAGADVEGLDAASPGYGRVGTALGRALLTTGGSAVDETATQLRAAFVEGELISFSAEPDSRATLAVVVTGPRTAGSAEQGGSLAAMVAAMDQTGRGVVVSGPASASADGGLIAAVRDAEGTSQISTVDVTDTPAGRVVVALAAAREAAGEAGAWGTSRSSDGAVPTE